MTMLQPLIESSLRVALLALAVAGVLWMLRVRESPPRHAAWTAVLVVMLFMPLLQSVVPGIAVRVPAPIAAIAPDVRAITEVLPVARDPQSPSSSARRVAPAPAITAALPVPQPAPAKPQAAIWPIALPLVYAIGVVALLARLAAGAWRVARLRRSATPVDLPDAGLPIYASTRVAVPVTIGVIRSSVILPIDWPSWPPTMLAGALAHERAHAQRHDLLVLFLAHVNRCVFWFHPLAWWLEQTLARTAEYACDDEAARAMGAGRPYADVLVAMAERVRVRRSRVVWSGAGIDGAGLLGQRIDRVMADGVAPGLSRLRKAALIAGCLTAIVVAVACRERVVAAPLKEDPDLAANLAQQKARSEEARAVMAMTREQVAALEAKVKADPEDIADRKTLITFYTWSGQKLLGWNEMVTARRPHVLWLIEHHPDDDAAAGGRLLKDYEPVGYAAARKLWMAQIAKPDASLNVLSNAASFFRASDKPEAEQLLLRLEAKDPGGPRARVRDHVFYSPWTSRLGYLYAQGIVGSNDDTVFNVVKSGSLSEAHGPFATHARQVLDASQDAALLLAAGEYLTRNAQNAKVDFDYVALGRTYLERAATLDPSSPATRLLASLRSNDAYLARGTMLTAKAVALAGGEIARKFGAHESLTSDEWTQVRALEVQAAMAMIEVERLPYLLQLSSPSVGEELVRLASKFPGDLHVGDAMFQGHVMRARQALDKGDVKAAVRFMTEAAQVSSVSEDLQHSYPGSFPDSLADAMLKAGERESVAKFLDTCAKLLPQRRDQLSKAAASVRAGTMPETYQYMVTPH